MSIYVIEIKRGQPIPDLEKSVGVIYNNDDGEYIIVFADSVEEAKSVNIEDSKFDIVTINHIEYRGYAIIDKVSFEREEAAREYNRMYDEEVSKHISSWDETPDYEMYWEADGN